MEVPEGREIRMAGVDDLCINRLPQSWHIHLQLFRTLGQKKNKGQPAQGAVHTWVRPENTLSDTGRRR